MLTETKNKENKTKSKGKSVLIIGLLIILQVCTASLVSCALVFYGPFHVVRNMIVGTAMSSYKHQYIAKTFLDDSKITEIVDSGMERTGDIEEKIGNIKVTNYDDKSIERYNIDGSRFKGYMLVVKNPLRVKVGVTNALEKQGERTSDIGKDHNAIAAINGGGFTDKTGSGNAWTGTGAYPIGFVISGGEVIYNDQSKDNPVNVVALDNEGKLIIGEHNLEYLKKHKVSEAITFSPPLVINGHAAFKGDGGQGITARTAIGQREDGAILLLVVDGRRLDMPGATLRDMQKIMLDYKAYNATSLDGGSSTTMYYNGKLINNPCNPLGERTVATALYVEP